MANGPNDNGSSQVDASSTPALSPPTDTEVFQKLEDARNYRARWNKRDFFVAQSAAAASLIVSLTVTIASAHGVADPYRWVVAVLAAIPGFLVCIESAFNFSVRCRLNSVAAFDIELMQNELRGGAEPGEVLERYLRYMKRLEQQFPAIAVLPSLAATPRAGRRRLQKQED